MGLPLSATARSTRLRSKRSCNNKRVYRSLPSTPFNSNSLLIGLQQLHDESELVQVGIFDQYGSMDRILTPDESSGHGISFGDGGNPFSDAQIFCLSSLTYERQGWLREGGVTRDGPVHKCHWPRVAHGNMRTYAPRLHK